MPTLQGGPELRAAGLTPLLPEEDCYEQAALAEKVARLPWVAHKLHQVTADGPEGGGARGGAWLAHRAWARGCGCWWQLVWVPLY